MQNLLDQNKKLKSCQKLMKIKGHYIFQKKGLLISVTLFLWPMLKSHHIFINRNSKFIKQE